LQAASNNRHGANNHQRFNIMRRNFQQDRQSVREAAVRSS
jgi:hypothetical protein